MRRQGCQHTLQMERGHPGRLFLILRAGSPHSRKEDRHCDPSPRHGEASSGCLLAAFLGQVVTHLYPHPMFGVAPSNPFQR